MENSGKKIKTASKCLFYIALAGAVFLLISGFIMIAQGQDYHYSDDFLGKYYEYGSDLKAAGIIYIVWALILVPISYISSLLMHGFGELIENSYANKPESEKTDVHPTQNNVSNTLDSLLESGLITQEEYEEKKNTY